MLAPFTHQLWGQTVAKSNFLTVMETLLAKQKQKQYQLLETFSESILSITTTCPNTILGVCRMNLINYEIYVVK